MIPSISRTKSPSPFGAIRFVELLGRSNFSFLQGASHPEEMVLHAKELGYAGFTLCDLNGLYGVIRAYQAIEFPSNFLARHLTESQDFKFLCGAEMQIFERGSVVLIPMNKEGYGRLCQLITKARRNSPKGFTGLNAEELLSHNEDLLALALPPWDREFLKRLRLHFSDRLYLPVWKDFSWASVEHYNQALVLEREGYSLVASQRPFMHHPNRKPLHDVLTCILHGITLQQARNRLLANSERHLKPLHELALLWRDRPDLLEKTLEVAKRVDFSLKELKYQYPQEALPKGMNATEYLREITGRGLSWRYPLGVPEKVRKTCEHELKLIHELAYEHYFLTLYDICEFARAQKILFQGRGSAANSIVCYALGLTAVDPTKVELLFERFISKERGEPPDIDIDFDSQRREEVIQYIYQKYGSDHAAMVCTVICYRSRMALREVAKTLGITLPTVDKIIKFMGREGLSRLQESPEKAKEWNLSTKQYQLLLDLASALKGFPRHLGIHTGGFLISQRPIFECVPVEKATMDKRYVIQWNKDDLEILKMMKIDVLGLGMLGALEKSFQLLERHKNLKIDLASIPNDDRPTYEMIQKADTVGVFQIESRAQMSLLPRLKPRCYYDLVVEVAIVRPGPIQGGMVHPYLKRREGVEHVAYPHPDLKPILGKTFGVPIFQEQIMQIASTVAGFTPGEADELRRIMSSTWKKPELMQGLRQRLISGMLSHGINMHYAEQIYQTIVGFSSYGFPESHAASFALLTYASCYLKKHHPDAFVAALLNSQPMGFYSPRALIQDAARHGVRFLPLDVQISDYDYMLEPATELAPTDNLAGESSAGASATNSHLAPTPESPAKEATAEASLMPVRVGFRAIYGLKEEHARQLIAAREQGGPFADLTDFVKRTELPKSTLLRLAAAGAFRSFNLEARQAMWQVQSMELKPESLFFAQAREGLQTLIDKDQIPHESAWDELTREYTHQGFSLTQHPIGLFRSQLNGFQKAKDLERLSNGRFVRLAGLMSTLQRPPTAKGFAFVTLEDETGLFNLILTPAVYEQVRLTLLYNPLLEVRGRLQIQQGVIHVKCESAHPLLKEQKLLPKSTPRLFFN